MKKMLFLATVIAATLMGCNKHNYNATNVFGEWDLAKINGQAIVKTDDITMPFIGFNQQEDRIYGNAGCNSFFGTMITDSTNVDALSFDNMGSTKMMCANMEVEDALLAALAQVKAIEYNAEQLQLKDANNQTILEFTRRK